MAKDYEKELKNLRAKVQEAEKTKVQLETRKEEATNRKAELVDECEEMGVNPAELDEAIAKLETDIDSILTKVKQHLPEEEDSLAVF